MKRYTNAQIAEVVKYIIENVEMLNNALDDALRVTEVEQQNKRYREALELLVKQETLGKDAKTGKTAISYNGMIALKGLGIFNEDEYLVYGVDEVIENVSICDRCGHETYNYDDKEGYIICNSCIYEMLGGN